MTNWDSALDLKIGPKDKDTDKKKQKNKLTREDEELSWSLKLVKGAKVLLLWTHKRSL